MNIILNGAQSDTKVGAINLTANSNLTGLENYLVKVVNSNGVAKFDLPSALTDYAYFILGAGDVAGNNVTAEQPGLDMNCRVAFSGNCNPGDPLCLNANAWGQLIKPAAGAGTIYYDWIAEEAGAGGTTTVPQLLLVRRLSNGRTATL